MPSRTPTWEPLLHRALVRSRIGKRAAFQDGFVAFGKWFRSRSFAALPAPAAVNRDKMVSVLLPESDRPSGSGHTGNPKGLRRIFEVWSVVVQFTLKAASSPDIHAMR
jgi:hypothetical protein